MVWIYLIVQALILWMIGRRFKEKHDGVYAVTLNITCLLSLFLGVVMAPLLVKLLPFLLIAPSRFLPDMGRNGAWTQRSLAQTAKDYVCLFASSVSSRLGGLFSRTSQSPETAQSYTSFNLTEDPVFTWSTFKDVLLLLGGSLTAWFSYLSYEIAHAIPETLTKFGNKQVG